MSHVQLASPWLCGATGRDLRVSDLIVGWLGGQSHHRSQTNAPIPLSPGCLGSGDAQTQLDTPEPLGKCCVLLFADTQMGALSCGTRGFLQPNQA